MLQIVTPKSQLAKPSDAISRKVEKKQRWPASANGQKAKEKRTKRKTIKKVVVKIPQFTV